MAVVYSEIEAQAMSLPSAQRNALMTKLLISLDGDSGESPQVIAAAWDVEIARRVDEFEAGRTQGVPYEEVRSKLLGRLARGNQ